MKNVEKNTIESKINELENISKILDNPELYLQESIKLVKHLAEDLGYRYLSASSKEELKKVEEIQIKNDEPRGDVPLGSFGFLSS